MNIKLCFLAPSEYGKNTAVNILKKHYKIKNIKLAKPWYTLQKRFYKFIHVKMTGEQDGELLQYLGKKIRAEQPHFIINKFKKQLKKYRNYKGFITNDDCRTPDYDELKKLGFIFIKINGFKRNRPDHTKSDSTSNLEWHNNIPYDFQVDNMGTLIEYERNLLSLIKNILERSK